MNIQFNEAKGYFKLDTNKTSYIIGLADEKRFVGHVYYGPRIEDGDDITYLMRLEENPFVPSKNRRDEVVFKDSFPNEYSTYGVGDFRTEAIRIRDEKGYRHAELIYKDYRIISGKPELEGLPATFEREDARGMTLEIDCEDATLHVGVTLSYSIFDDCDIVARHSRIHNAGTATIALEKAMSLCLDMDNEDFECMTLHGSWARERHMSRRAVTYGQFSVGSLRGETSHQEHPFIGLVHKETTQRKGSAYGFHFVYSGNFLAQVETNQFDMTRILMGIHPTGFEWRLDAGQTFTTPEVICNYSDEGIGGMTRQFHEVYRHHLIRSPYLHTKRPILINNWEATYFDFDTDKLLAIAKEASQLGIEMLVMDDGWFGHREDDNTSLGDWIVNEQKLRGGLASLVEQVNALGMKFGIWFEPEMVSPDSDLYRQHPDWVIQVPGREPARCRNQYVLDMSRADVRDHIYSMLHAILSSANIEYVKWDMNRPLTDIGSMHLDDKTQGELYHRYVMGMYALQERMVQDFPTLLLENCSGGGARFDPGMLYYSPQIWCSDDTDAIERLRIQEGTAMLYPLSSIGAHVSDCPNHTVGRSTPMETRGFVALMGTFGYELDVTAIDKADREKIPEQVAMYHRYNDLVREGDYYRLASVDQEGFDSWAVVSKDKSEALVTCVEVMARANSHSRKLRLDGLDAMTTYTVMCRDKEYEVSGKALMHAGILLPKAWGDYIGYQIHVVRKSRALTPS